MTRQNIGFPRGSVYVLRSKSKVERNNNLVCEESLDNNVYKVIHDNIKVKEFNFEIGCIVLEELR